MDEFRRKIDIYKDVEFVVRNAKKTQVPSDTEEPLLEINLSEPETLYSVSCKIRSFLQDKPDDYQFTLYLVCGNIPSKDANLIADYIKSITQPIVIAFRGVVHFDFIEVLVNREVYISPSSQIQYSKSKLHDTLRNIMLGNSEISTKFMKRFIDEYWKLNEGSMLPISELAILGLNIKSL